MPCSELESEGSSPIGAPPHPAGGPHLLRPSLLPERYFQNLEKPQNPRSHQLVLQRLQQCNDRYLASVKALAQVRKMRVPNLQVNIGEKQINVAS